MVFFRVCLFCFPSMNCCTSSCCTSIKLWVKIFVS
jgi:hypothetical protein